MCCTVVVVVVANVVLVSLRLEQCGGAAVLWSLKVFKEE